MGESEFVGTGFALSRVLVIYANIADHVASLDRPARGRAAGEAGAARPNDKSSGPFGSRD